MIGPLALPNKPALLKRSNGAGIFGQRVDRDPLPTPHIAQVNSERSHGIGAQALVAKARCHDDVEPALRLVFSPLLQEAGRLSTTFDDVALDVLRAPVGHGLLSSAGIVASDLLAAQRYTAPILGKRCVTEPASQQVQV